MKSRTRTQLCINIGKGGVGKSAVTAAIALHAAQQGKKVLVCEVNTRGRMANLFHKQAPTSFDTLDQVWQVQENLWTVNIDPWPAMKEYVIEVLKMRLVYNLVFENKYMKYFLQAIPGLQELVFVGKVWYHVQQMEKKEPKYDLIILDSPSTGHGIAMLDTPRVLMDTIPLGPMHTAANRIYKMLTNKEITTINLITLPEEMPINETLELNQELQSRANLQADNIFINKAAHTEDIEAPAFLEESTLFANHQNWSMLLSDTLEEQQRNKKSRRLAHELKEKVTLPIFELPAITNWVEDFQLVKKLASHVPDLFSKQNR